MQKRSRILWVRTCGGPRSWSATPLKSSGSWVCEWRRGAPWSTTSPLEVPFRPVLKDGAKGANVEVGQLVVTSVEALHLAEPAGLCLAALAQRGVEDLQPRDALLLRDWGFRPPSARYHEDDLLQRKGEPDRSHHMCEPVDPSEKERKLWAARYAYVDERRGAGVTPFVGPLPNEEGDKAYHLVQDRDVVEEIEKCELPPAEYYEELRKVLPSNSRARTLNS